jgi:hypothetical protein
LGKIDANAMRFFVKFDRIEFGSIFNRRRQPAWGLWLGASDMVSATVRLGGSEVFGNRNFTMPGESRTCASAITDHHAGARPALAFA